MEAVSLIRLISHFLPSTQRCVAAVLALSALLLFDAKAQRLLDLIGDRPASSDIMMVPGASPGSMNRPTPLSLDLTIQDIYPLVASQNDRVTVQILMRNAGKEPIEIPSSRDTAGIIGSYGITVTTGAGVSNVWYFNVVPEIDFGGADITDLTGLSAVTGQQIALTTVAPLPSGVSISSQSWTVPGTTVGGFAATSYLLGVPLTGGPLPTDFSENSNTFYWVDAANARQVRYEVTLSDGQILDSYALFNVGGPVAPVVSVVSGSVVTDQNILVNPSTGQPYYDPSGTQVLVYEGVSKLPLAGNPTPTFPNPYTAGITISGSVTQPPGVAGKMVFVQLLDSYNVVLSAPGLQNGGCLFAGLDGGFPYGAVGPSSGPTTYMYDSPKVPLGAPTTYASAIFSAHAYVMWQPSLPSSIPVPLGYVRWGLSGYAENNGAAWVLDTSDPVNKPNAGYASDFQVGNTYPNWSSFVPPQPSCAKPN
jgi:hypothetical protein